MRIKLTARTVRLGLVPLLAPKEKLKTNKMLPPCPRQGLARKTKPRQRAKRARRTKKSSKMLLLWNHSRAFLHAAAL